MVRKKIEKIGEHRYNLVVWKDDKVIYNNLCIGEDMKRRKDAEIKYKKLRKIHA